MRFLLVAGFPGSILTFRGALISALQKEGAEVHIAAPFSGAPPELMQDLRATGAKLHSIALARTGTNPLADFRLLLQLYLLMRRIRPQMFLGYTIKPVIYGSIAAWLAGVEKRFALITGLGYAFADSRRRSFARLIHRLYAFALARVHKAFFQNPDDLGLFKQLGILDDRTAAVVVNGSGVDVSHYSFAPIADIDISFLMIGRLLGAKGVREYAGAARKVKAVDPGAEFRLVGRIDNNPDSIDQAELDAWIEEGLVEYLGPQFDVRPALRRCTVYVLPSYREGTPRTVLEAMAIGRPIITTDAPGCRETTVDGQNGYLVAPRSEQELADAMMRFIESPGLAAEMGMKSREIAEQKYDVDKVNAMMLAEMGFTSAGGQKPSRDAAVERGTS